MKNILVIILVFTAFCTMSLRAEEIIIVADTSVSQIQFAVTDLKLALEGHGFETVIQKEASKKATCIILSSQNPKLLRELRKKGAEALVLDKDESFSIRITESDKLKKYWAVGKDLTGTMYAGLELAETIRLKGVEGIKKMDCAPYIEKRGLKYNIPFDARTPSYSDAGSAAQHNIGTVWEMSYWMM
jgi:hypothetical protein